ncbi:putative sodium-coupled neutral amino acid transporter 7 [Neodiprion virginianus]|uniref:putative sodium-coupled neutral amino acid transporter 7 n=1 Tax=Neodiprion fabricii TaxID=2872261 RepID=UPI001ED936F6|nr:putative sodium-coupled neutral amino acid transporter 7 [Neodiprion fabricii]XP_046426614.1 putative sodium-coupled neutral amino acid transporter 7 [Neodiprion fabricii]XP_046619985.1 putative sodium-coupled neutral amino acid transporter 7 [Neodiprion virginianus]XP_046619990.1 putative sodium-coupled neutral amino acid transporter 7 [Neodiprion virginianus]
MNYLRRDNERLIGNEIVLTTAPSANTESSQECTVGAGSLATIFLIVNATLGAGLLNFPQAFDKSGGVITSILVQLVFLIFITTAIIVLAHCSDSTNSSSLQDTLAGLCGPKSLTFCAICVVVYSFGCCITFLIVIGDQFDRVLATVYGTDFCHYWYLSRGFTSTLTCCILILPLCFSKRLDVLSYVSSLGCLAVIYVVWLIVYKSYIIIGEPSKPMKMWPIHWTEIFQVVPVVCFSYQCHMSVIPMYACMKDRKLGKFTVCAIVSMLVCFIAYTIAGIFGYSTFGIGKVPDDILQGYSDGGTFLTVAIVAIALKNVTTYPIILFCGREAFLGLCTEYIQSLFMSRVILSLVWVALNLVIAITVSDITPVINLMGSLSAAFIFIFPGICLLQNTLIKDPYLYLNKDKCIVIFSAFLLAVGAFVCGVVFVESIQDMVREKSTSSLVTGFRIGIRDSLCV